MYPATAKLIDISYIEALKLYFPTSFHSRTKKNNVYTVTRSAWHIPVSVYRIKGPLTKF